MENITLLANAKLNLTLDITGKREDGYHLLDGIMQSVSLCDRITVRKSDGIQVDCSSSEISGKNNIAYKAAVSFFEFSGINGGCRINIEKHIPEAAGLGGGSADAAAVLVGLDRIYETGFSDKELESLALGLGADVPFFINGGTQRAQGIGEKLTKLKTLEKGFFLIAKRDEKLSTSEMYRQIDGGKKVFTDTQKAINACQNGDFETLCSCLGNSFLEIWKNSSLYKEMLLTEADGVSVSGSGPSFFAVFSDETAAKKAFEKIKLISPYCYLTTPAIHGITVENTMSK